MAATIAAGLWIDQRVAGWGQAAISAWVWLLFLGIVIASRGPQRRVLLFCLLYATLGEVVLSLVWKVYEYRLGNLPLFVPPGHVLLLLLGIGLAQRIPPRLAPWIAAAAAPFVALLAWTGTDTVSAPLFGLLLLCLALSRARALYSIMFLLALAMELYGTWLGNWSWAATVPGLRLTAGNPPLAAGAFYCVLDLLVVASAGRGSLPAAA
ncbi:MAG: hypothetical protein HYU77_00105 [Betaproteobacteria bacterium]|nr:hypothetical protein [Betaproteobacteria bacterium]